VRARIAGVFDPAAKPWIQPGDVDAETCLGHPALPDRRAQLERDDGAQTIAATNTAALAPDGPALAR
jgi:hypothetical protein